MDLALLVALVMTFALLVTAHLGLAVALVVRSQVWRALLGLVLPPLLAYWAWQQRLRAATVLWMFALVLYAATRLLASR